MKGKCPNCNADLRYVKSINKWLCNDCSFTVEAEPITVEETPKIQSNQKSLNSLELYLLAFSSSFVLTLFFSWLTRGAYPLQTLIILLILATLFYWIYWGLFTTEGRKFNKEYNQQQGQNNMITRQSSYNYGNNTSSTNSSASKPFSSSYSSQSSSGQSSNSKRFVTILSSGEIHILSQTIPEVKIAIKELKLKKKEYNLEKKGIIQKQKEIRANYTDAMRRRRSPRLHFFPSSEISRRDDARRNLANALKPLDQQKNSIETKISLVDQAILHLEKFIAGLQ